MGEILLTKFEDADVLGDTVEDSTARNAGGIKLTKKSRVVLDEAEDIGVAVKRLRPSLLDHRKEKETEEKLAECAVSGQFVLGKEEVAGWSVFPFFPDRVETGEQRIKKKKKKVKKKTEQTKLEVTAESGVTV